MSLIDEWYTLIEVDKNNPSDSALSLIPVFQKIKELDEENKKISTRLHELEIRLEKSDNENLLLRNKMLEAEVSLERTKNSLIRRNIPFPFNLNLTKLKQETEHDK